MEEPVNWPARKVRALRLRLCYPRLIRSQLMLDKSLSLIDDDPEDLPNQYECDYFQKQYGFESILADANDAVASGIELLEQHSHIAAVVTYKCGRSDFSHIAQMRAMRPHTPIALLSS